MKINIRHR